MIVTLHCLVSQVIIRTNLSVITISCSNQIQPQPVIYPGSQLFKQFPLPTNFTAVSLLMFRHNEQHEHDATHQHTEKHHHKHLELIDAGGWRRRDQLRGATQLQQLILSKSTE